MVKNELPNLLVSQKMNYPTHFSSVPTCGINSERSFKRSQQPIHIVSDFLVENEYLVSRLRCFWLHTNVFYTLVVSDVFFRNITKRWK